MNSLIKKFTPHGAALIIFILLTSFFYYPIFQGKRLYQSDVVNYKGMANESEFYFLRKGEWPLWTNSMFSGMPAYQVSGHYPANLFNRIYQNVNYFFKTGNFTLISLIGFYILLISLGINPWLAIGGAIAYALSTYFFIIIEVGHNSKTMALALLPPVAAGVLQLFKGKWLAGSTLIAFFLPLNLIANHAQMTYYFFITLFIYAMFEFYQSWKEKRLNIFFKASGILMVIGILAVGSNSTLLWMTYEYGHYSTRGKSELTLNSDVKTSGLDKDYATDWSYGVSETFTLLIPNFAGNSSQSELGPESNLYKTLREMGVSNAKDIAKNAPTYWGSQPFTEGPFYFGAAVCFLFFLGVFFVQGPFKWWLVTATILSILLSWGKNFMALTDLFFDYFPMYNKFRAVATILVIAMFAMPLLGFFALHNFIFPENGKTPKTADRRKKALQYALLVTGGLALVFALFPSVFLDFSSNGDKRLKEIGWPIDALIADRMQMLKSDAFRAFIFIALAGFLLWAYFKQWIKKDLLVFSIILLVLFDLGWVGKRYLPVSRFVAPKDIRLPYQPSRADMQILQKEMQLNPRIQQYADTLQNIFKEKAKEDIRESRPGNISDKEKLLVSFAAMDKLTDFRVFNLAVNTFNDASASYFHKSVGGYHGAKMKRYQELIEYHISRHNTDVLDMLNVKYYIVEDSARGIFAMPNPRTLGNAWFVQNHHIVANGDSEITTLRNFNPATTAIIDKRYSSYVDGLGAGGYDSLGIISLDDFELDRLSYSSQSRKEQLGVFSEIWYDKGWDAYIDGQRTPHIRVNYVLRALRIPAGKHKIEFRFYPENYYRCEKISLASSLLLLLFIFFAAGYYFLGDRFPKFGQNSIVNAAK